MENVHIWAYFLSITLPLLDCASSSATLVQCSFDTSSGPTADVPYTGVNLSHTSGGHEIKNCKFLDGINFASATTQVSIAGVGCAFTGNVLYGLRNGIVFTGSSVNGVMISNNRFIGRGTSYAAVGCYGVSIPTGATNVHIVGNQCSLWNQTGPFINAAPAAAPTIKSIFISSNKFSNINYLSNQSVIYLNNAAGISVLSNHFTGCSGTANAITIGAANVGANVSSNQFDNSYPVGANPSRCIVFTAGSTGFCIMCNNFGGLIGITGTAGTSCTFTPNNA